MTERESHRRALGSGRRRVVAGVCVLLGVVVLLVFGQTLRYGFVAYDDDRYVWRNAEVTGPLTLQGVARVFTRSTCNFYHPLTIISLMLDHQMYRLNASGYHLTNVLLHGATVVALFLVLRRATGRLWPSAFVAAAFAVHPLRVESVAWVAERKDVLSGLFFMLTLGAYVRYARLPFAPGRYLVVILLFTLGLLSKPTVVTLPFVLLLLDYWPLERFKGGEAAVPSQQSRIPSFWPALCPSRLVAEKLPLFALSAVASVAAVLAQKETVMTFEKLPLAVRITNFGMSYMAYVRQTFWPSELAVFYPYAANGASAWKGVLSLLVLATVSAGVYVWRRQRPYLLMGWLWYLGMLVPMSGIVQVGGFARADRHTYLPQIGICIFVTWAAKEMVSAWRCRQVLGAGGVAIIAALIMCAWRQTSYWRDSEVLWRHTLACTSRNAVGHNNLGYALAREGRLAEATEQYQAALKIKPNYARAHSNLGNALARQGRTDEAIAHYQRTVELEPDWADGHFNMGIVLAAQGRVAEAVQQYREAIRLKPDDADASYALGTALAGQGQLREALERSQRAVELDPGHLLARVSSAWLLATCPEPSLRDGRKAVELARQAERLPGGETPQVLDTLAAAYAEAGRFSEAVETARRALDLADTRHDTAQADGIRARLKLYAANAPYHQSP